MLHCIGLLASTKGVDEENPGSGKLPGLSFVGHQHHTSAARVNGVHTPPCAAISKPMGAGWLLPVVAGCRKIN